MSGLLVKKWTGTYDLNISDVPGGEYLLSISTEGKLYTEKIIKVN